MKSNRNVTHIVIEGGTGQLVGRVGSGGCWSIAIVTLRGRLGGSTCRNIVEISGRIFVAVPFPPVVLTLAAWSGVGALRVMSALEKKIHQHMGHLPLWDLQRIWVELE